MNYTPQPLMAPMIGLIIAVIWGLSTDYEVFLVSRMVEARERGMSTTEAIRIGTATTGRLITGAALVLAVVAGAFVFSDLVMMKYLAFGLLIALLLDATIIRMFLVPAIMKLLGDDCWWAPRWMKRRPGTLGLGETELPDERKRPTVREPEEALVGAGAPVGAAAAAAARPDPSRPRGPRGRGPRRGSRPRRRGRRAVGCGHHADPEAARPQAPQRAADHAAVEAKNAVRMSRTTRAPRATRTARPAGPPRSATSPAAAARAEEREIESWLGDLRGTGPPVRPPRPQPLRPSGEPDPGRCPTQRRNEPTTAIPRSAAPQATTPTRPTRAIPTAAPGPDADAATEKTQHPRTRRRAEGERRGGGGVSAQDLLRREGRLYRSV